MQPRKQGQGRLRRRGPDERERRCAGWQLLVGLQSAEALGGFDHRGSRPAQGHGRIPPSLHVATDPTDRAFMFSMMLVQANERRSSSGMPRRVTVRISSMPSRMLAETPGASRSSRRA